MEGRIKFRFAMQAFSQHILSLDRRWIFVLIGVVTLLPLLYPNFSYAGIYPFGQLLQGHASIC